MYYEINEQMARRAKEMNSFYNYIPGSATEEYRKMVDHAWEVAETQKTKIDPMYHEKIDSLAERYSKKLAENLNNYYRIETMCPSVMIAGPARFPVKKKEKQNAARDKNRNEYQYIQRYLDKIQSIGTGAISADDKNAIPKLQTKMDNLLKEQAEGKAQNVYYRKHGTMLGYPRFTDEEAKRLDAEIKAGYSWEQKPYTSYELTSINSKIKRLQERLARLEKAATQETTEQEHDGFIVKENTELNRLQIIFEGKPDEEIRAVLKSNGFKWAPSQGAWQRQLTDNARYAAERIVKEMQQMETER